jgi:NitT/TauT family transport system permease protein
VHNESASIFSGRAHTDKARRRRLRAIWAHARTIVLPLLVLIILLLAWEAGVRAFKIPEFVLPAPSRIWQASVAARDVIFDNMWSTLRTTLYGFLASIIVSVPLAVLIASSPLLSNSIYPLLVLTQSVPKVAIAPLIVVAVGATETSRVIVAFLVAFFPLVISVAAGLIATNPELIELGRSLRATKLQELWHIRLPFAVPFVFSGLKLSITFAVTGAVVGEFVAADKGLGYQILSGTAFFKTAFAFGAVVLLSVMGIVLFQAVVLAERLFFPWSLEESGNG